MLLKVTGIVATKIERDSQNNEGGSNFPAEFGVLLRMQSHFLNLILSFGLVYTLTINTITTTITIVCPTTANSIDGVNLRRS
jgi:hypothetical protein